VRGFPWTSEGVAGGADIIPAVPPARRGEALTTSVPGPEATATGSPARAGALKKALLIPGPTPLPPRVLQAGVEPMRYHRARDFTDLWAETLARLGRVFQTECEVLVITASGSGGMASALANLSAPGDRVLVASCGSFGDRWVHIAGDHGVEPLHLAFEWGTRVDPDAVARALAENPEVEVVYTTHSETSTGVVNDLRAIREAAGDRILVVDAVSALGVVDLPMDAWGVDVVVAGSQKGLMAPPGLAFVAASPRAIARAAEKRSGGFYLGWERTRAGQNQTPRRTAFTPPVTLVVQLHTALGMIEEEGLPNVFARHRVLGEACRAAGAALGLRLLGPDDPAAAVATAFWPPEGVEARAITRLLRERFGVQVAGGQGRLQGKIVRFGHCGWYAYPDILVGVGALEQVLDELGVPVALGAGLAAAQQVFATRLRGS
jgi:serine---pyruvate transaminase